MSGEILLVVKRWAAKRGETSLEGLERLCPSFNRMTQVRTAGFIELLNTLIFQRELVRKKRVCSTENSSASELISIPDQNEKC